MEPTDSDLARTLFETKDVLGVDLSERGVVVRAKNPAAFYRELGGIIVKGSYQVTRLEPLDDSAHAIIGYLLGGSGKT